MAKKQIRGLNPDQFQLLLFKIMNRRTVVRKVQLKFWSWVMTHLHYGRSEPRHHRKIKSCERMNSKCTVKLEYYRSRLSLIYYLYITYSDLFSDLTQ